jgi:hypothetical protein
LLGGKPNYVDITNTAQLATSIQNKLGLTGVDLEQAVKDAPELIEQINAAAGLS